MLNPTTKFQRASASANVFSERWSMLLRAPPKDRTARCSRGIGSHPPSRHPPAAQGRWNGTADNVILRRRTTFLAVPTPPEAFLSRPFQHSARVNPRHLGLFLSRPSSSARFILYSLPLPLLPKRFPLQYLQTVVTPAPPRPKPRSSHHGSRWW